MIIISNHSNFTHRAEYLEEIYHPKDDLIMCCRLILGLKPMRIK